MSAVSPPCRSHSQPINNHLCCFLSYSHLVSFCKLSRCTSTSEAWFLLPCTKGDIVKLDGQGTASNYLSSPGEKQDSLKKWPSPDLRPRKHIASLEYLLCWKEKATQRQKRDVAKRQRSQFERTLIRKTLDNLSIKITTEGNEL